MILTPGESQNIVLISVLFSASLNTTTNNQRVTIAVTESDITRQKIAEESQLRGFERISLQPGEKKTVQFTLHPEDLAIPDRNLKWTVEREI